MPSWDLGEGAESAGVVYSVAAFAVPRFDVFSRPGYATSEFCGVEDSFPGGPVHGATGGGGGVYIDYGFGNVSADTFVTDLDPDGVDDVQRRGRLLVFSKEGVFVFDNVRDGVNPWEFREGCFNYREDHALRLRRGQEGRVEVLEGA